MRKQNIFTRTTISVLVASSLAAMSVPAFAASDAEIQQMQHEIQMLEQKLDAMKADVQTTKEAQKATEVKVEKAAHYYNTDEAIRGVPNGGGFHAGGATVTFGGFLASETAYRSRSLQSDISSPFSQIPFASSVADNRYNQSEFRGTERQSRLSIEAKANVTPSIVATGYYEMDFLAAAQTANPNQSNSFSPRTRHVYANIDWLDSGFHLLAGQTWSLATLETDGLDAKHHWTPLTIDAQYVVGFNWVRQWQLRMTQDWGKKYWASLSLENSQTHGAAGTLPNGVTAYGTTLPNVGGSLFNSANVMSYNKYPDIVLKFAADTSMGHYEIYDLSRNFQSASTAVAGGPSVNTWTNALGLGAYIPVIPKVLDIQATYLTGKGIGRYGTTQLNDATYAADGSLMPLKGTDYLLGATWNAAPKWTFYGNYGMEKVDSNTYACTAGTCGFGDGTALTIDSALKDAKESVVGFWWSFYKGNFGALKLGMQYSHVTLDAFNTTGAAPVGSGLIAGNNSTTDNMFFTSIRYYPF
ncbi:MAG TPA: hypothetical protein PLK99_05665 [Burkholderiales bacterium]|nr:hypothetical protein [Burkholderiales bacterium]